MRWRLRPLPLYVMKKSLMDIFMEEDYTSKVATAFDEPVDQMPGPRQPSYRPAPNNIDYQKGNNSFMKVTPGAVLGSALGLTLGYKKGKKDAERKMQEELNRFNNAKPVIDGNYYQQAQHVMNNLGVVFTPFGTVYTIKDKNKNVAIDTIEIEEMNKAMKSAWKNRDGEYFKGLMLTKMYSEMQIAEQGFAKKILEMQNSNDKTADEIEYEVSEMTDLDRFIKVAELEECFSFTGKETEEYFEKISSIQEYFEGLDDVQFRLKLDRPFEKCAGVLSGIKSCLGFGETHQSLKQMQKNLSNPSYLKNNLKVGFMPDRVIFTVDETLVSTLSLTNMNEDGYDNFQKSNSKYFKDLFVQEMKKSTNQKIAFTEVNHLEKVASADDISTDIRDIFTKSSIHPVIYYLLLTQRLSTEWFDYDPMALVKIVESEFNLEQPLSDSALDKILSIQAANKSDAVYSVPHAFEKVVRAFNDKPIDFLEREDDDLDVDDFAFAIDVLDRVTPYDDIYDNFSPEVLDYIASTLAKKDSRCYAPSYIVGSPLEPKFQEVLNEILLRVTNKFTTDDTFDAVLEKQVIDRNGYIHDMSSSVIKAVRRALENKNTNPALVVSEMIKKIGVPEELTIMVKREVVKNLAVDEVLKLNENRLNEQLIKYNMANGGAGING